MSAIHLPSTEEINAAYEDGREAMMALADRIQRLETNLPRTAASRHPATDTINLRCARKVCENDPGEKALGNLVVVATR